jgi:RNA polymerase sigma factor (sigma-70 family)
VCSFDEAYQTFYPRVVRHLTYLLGDRAAAEDLAQETFLKLYTVPPPTWQNLGGWLYRVGARLALNYLRGERRRQKRELEEGETRGAEVIPLEEVIWRQETVRKVRRVLAEMPARDRIALLLRHSGFTYQEIASVLEVMPGSVGALLARAQRRFLEKYRLQEGDRS